MSKYLIYAAVFLTPLIFNLSTRELFEFPKMIFIYLLASSVPAGLAIFPVLTKRVEPPLPAKSLIFLLIAVLLSTAFSVDRNTSLLGYYTRFNGGYLSLLACAALFFLSLVALSPKIISRISVLISLSSSIVSAYAFLLYIGIDKNFWIQDSQARAFSTLGQPNWLAAYLLMTLPVTFHLLLSAKSVRERLLHFSAGLLTFAGIWFTYSLSGFLGLAAVFTATFFFFERERLVKNRRIILLLLSCALFVAVKEQGPFGTRLKAVSKVLAESPAVYAAEKPPGPAGSMDTSLIRVIVWEGAVKLFLSDAKTALIGAGPETFAYAFLPFRPAELNRTTEWDFLYNKAHNYYLDILTGSGILGMTAYLFFVFSVFRFYKTSPVEIKNRSAPFLTGWSSLLVTNIFGWPTVSANLLFFIFPAFMLILSSGRADKPEIQTRPPGIFTKITSVVFLILAAKTISGVFFADVYFARALDLSKQGYLSAADEQFITAIKKNPLEPAYRREYAFNLAQQALAAEENDRGDRLKVIEEAAAQAETAERLNPRNSLTLKSLLRTFYILAKINPALEERVTGYAEKITRLAPTEPKSFYDAALIFSYLDKKKEAAEYAQRAIILKPDFEEAQNLLGRMSPL